MTSRREFLHATALLSTVPLSTSAGIEANASLQLSAVVIDSRYSASRLFGTHAQHSDLALHRINGDITELWLAHLRPQWTSKPAAIAGLTGRPALFCLEQLAWDYHMRVVYHAEHREQPGSSTTHTVHTASLGLSAAELSAAGGAWPRYAAGAILRRSNTRTVCGPSLACMEAAVGDDEFTLHSWVIAT
jgi:hypothetical protein